MGKVKIYREGDYSNFLDTLPDYCVLRKNLEDVRYYYKCPPRYNRNNPYEKTIEETFNSDMPMFNEALTSYIKTYNKIPTEEEFLNYYYNGNIPFFVRNKIDDNNYKKAIYNRCGRAYASILRDLLFGKYLQSKGVKVIYNETVDSCAEIDLLITGNNGNWGLHLFVNTDNANNCRSKKNDRYHFKFGNVKEIDLPLNISDCTKVNNLCLYDDREFEQLKNIVKKILLNK